MKQLHRWASKWASPVHFNHLSNRFLPWVAPIAWGLLVVGIVGGLVIAPQDYLQKDIFRIIYIHVPSAMLSMSIYVAIALASAIFFIWRWRIAAIFARAAAPYGFMLTLSALVTGSLWGRPTWGTYWTWDARLTSELILLFLYLSYMLLLASFEDKRQGERIAAILAIVGVINIPIIHFSVVWWNSLHQSSTLLNRNGPSIAPSMLWPLLTMLAAFSLLFFVFVMRQMQNIMLEERIIRRMEE